MQNNPTESHGLPDLSTKHNKRQGITLRIGESVSIKGGWFRVERIRRKMVQLRAMPATTVGRG